MSVAELATDVRHLGLRRALARSAYYRANRLWGVRVYQYMALEPGGVERELLERDVPYDCRILDAGEVSTLSADPANGIERASLPKTLAKGDVCFGILDGPVLASCGWYANAASTVLKEVTVTFNPRYTYMYGGYTRPHYRGQNLHGIGLARACIALHERGFAGVVTLAERVNFASLRSAHRVGFRDCGIAVAVVVGTGDRVRIWQTQTPAQYAMRLVPSSAMQRDAGAVDERIAGAVAADVANVESAEPPRVVTGDAERHDS